MTGDAMHKKAMYPSLSPTSNESAFLSRFVSDSILLGAWCMQNGDKVVYSKFAGTEVEVDGSEHVILKVTSWRTALQIPSIFLELVHCAVHCLNKTLIVCGQNTRVADSLAVYCVLLPAEITFVHLTL